MYVFEVKMNVLDLKTYDVLDLIMYIFDLKIEVKGQKCTFSSYFVFRKLRF